MSRTKGSRTEGRPGKPTGGRVRPAGLAGILGEAIEAPEGYLDEKQFDGLALRLFAHQYEAMPAYRALCNARGGMPETVRGWRAIPAVSTSLFRTTAFFAGSDDAVAAVFATSGTTGGETNRGRSHFSTPGLELMEAGIVVNARRMLFPDIDRSHILVLAPSPELAPQMIMAWGMDRLIRHFGTPESRFLIGRSGLDVPLLVDLLGRFSKGTTPVTLIGASFGFVNLIEGFRSKGIAFALPPGSRTMDAGGFKGKSRVLTRAELRTWISETFGIADGHAVNLLGMTELASQFYDDGVEATVAGRVPCGLKQNPPWTRTRAVDPLTLEDVPAGSDGVLLHLDLANLDTPMAVLTDDLGVCRPDGFEVLGRLSSDDSRGCSLTIDELTRSRP
ncbi:MAG: long-chain fatty acid--CoA ligase [Deltaproteobacteria bacterium]|nr:long-chain fatty acid--CoA ligase [Deltaproteobacteria bacterium]